MRSDHLDQIRAEQTRILFRNCPVGVISAATVALMLSVGLVLAGRSDTRLAAAWSALMIGVMAAHLVLCLAYRRASPADAQWRRWLRPFTLIALAEGAVWSLGAIWLTSSSDLTQELVVVLVSSAVASGSVPVFGTYLPTYIAFAFPTILPHLGFALFYSYPLHLLLAALVVFYLLAMMAVAHRANAQLIESLRLRFDNIELMQGLRAQTEIAIQANLAKSKFLAAASHDLRQPIHALGLFIGALKGRRLDEEAHRLIGLMDVSVSAMDELYASLLDISKLDAGVVEPVYGPVPLMALLARICADYAGEAVSKGVALRLVSTTRVVRSDPVLVERILRNLIANAVRYTESGGVLVGCRYAGDRVRVEVWDTGVGIAPGEREAIFQEFHQLGNPERDRTKGLGLGLAIVRRIALLIDCHVSLSSACGRGSVFRVSAPSYLGPLQDSKVSAPGEIFTSRGPILVIDDEVAIQDAMSALLSGWGLQHLIAASADEMIARLAGRVDKPTLVICDYRLRGGVTGVEAIAQIRGVCGADVPAMLVTGDTAPDRLAEAQASGFLLLHKPVPNGKLHAAIGNLTRPRAEPPL